MIRTDSATIIVLNYVDTSNVAADTENAVWIDEDTTADSIKMVTVNEETMIPEPTED